MQPKLERWLCLPLCQYPKFEWTYEQRGKNLLAWEWKRDGQRIADIGYELEKDWLTLNYGTRSNGGDWQTVTEPIRLFRVPCNLGGFTA